MKRPIYYLDPELNSQIYNHALKLLVKQLKFASDKIEYIIIINSINSLCRSPCGSMRAYLKAG